MLFHIIDPLWVSTSLVGKTIRLLYRTLWIGFSASPTILVCYFTLIPWIGKTELQCESENRLFVFQQWKFKKMQSHLLTWTSSITLHDTHHQRENLVICGSASNYYLFVNLCSIIFWTLIFWNNLRYENSKLKMLLKTFLLSLSNKLFYV